MYIYVYIYIYTHIYICVCIYIYIYIYVHGGRVKLCADYAQSPYYTRSPLEDPRLFGPSPWKILAAIYEQKGLLSNPAPGEDLVSGNLVMETGCNIGFQGV